MRVAVAGAGIAGLTSAIALAARGFEATLFERAAELHETGAGIQLSPNAMGLLERLGVTRELPGRLCEPDALAVHDGEDAAPLTRIPLGAHARARYGAPYCTMLRAHLQSALVATARKQQRIRLELGAPVTELRQGPHEITLSAGGASRRADMLIGADGMHSTVRAHFRYPPPRPLGQTAWRTVLPTPEAVAHLPADVLGLWLGRGGHLVHYPVDGGRATNIVVIAAGESAAPPVELFGARIRRLLERVPEWSASPLAVVDPVPSWSQGRVALVGDAAHAMAPSAAQGAAQAIEDAWVLATSLESDASNVPRALRRYDETRRPRAASVTRLAARSLNAYGWSGVPAALRNHILRSLPPRLFLHRLDWLFGWRPR